jgi:hypothetical protein
VRRTPSQRTSPAPRTPPKPPSSNLQVLIKFKFTLGCHDTQTSADASIGGHASGAMSWGLLKVLYAEHGKITYLDVLKETRSLLVGKYSQVPQMSAGRPMDVENTVFSLYA